MWFENVFDNIDYIFALIAEARIGKWGSLHWWMG